MVKILAWPVILFGVLWAVKPTLLRGAMTRKTSWQMFLLAAAMLFLPLLHLGSRFGLLATLLFIVLFFMALAKLHAAVGETFSKVPLVYFQAIGIINIVGGVCMLRL